MNKMEILKLPESYEYIAAFLTMRCNLNCSFCLNAFDKSFNRKGFEEVSGETWVEGLNRIESRPNVPITLCGGEPSMHKDFIYIINHIKPELNIDILTNLYWGKKRIERFIQEVNPNRLKRNAPYASIRVSYHPEQMGDGEKLVENVKKMQEAGFPIGIWQVLHPSPYSLEAFTKMQFRCRDAGIDFRSKDFTGEYSGKIYGDYSKYPDSTFQSTERNCECKTSELLIAPDCRVYRCHRDLFVEDNSVGSILNPNYEIQDNFRGCLKYGQCHPCDVKVKTNYKQQLGHTSVKIENIK
jgi:sulfatase maturation enzyme AslB (radical SAM superfamily)